MEGPDTTEPTRENVGPPLPGDAEPKTPNAETLALFERTRVAYGIPE